MLGRLDSVVDVLSLKHEKSFIIKRRVLIDAVLDVYLDNKTDSVESLLKCLSSDNTLNGISLDENTVCLHSSQDDLEKDMLTLPDTVADRLESVLR